MRDAALGPADAADGRDAVRHAQLDRPAGPGHRRASWRATCPGCCSTDARPIVSIAGSTLGEYAELARRRRQHARASPRSRSTSPARTSRTAAWSSPATRSRRRAVISAVRRDTPRGVPVFAKLSPDVTEHRRHRRVGASRPAPTGWSMINTLLGLTIDLDTHAARARRRHRRPVRAGDPAGRGPRGLAGAPGDARTSRSSVWGRPHRRRRAGVHGSPGASAVQVGTAIFNDPSAPYRIVGELRARAGRARLRQGQRGRSASPTAAGTDDRGRPRRWLTRSAARLRAAMDDRGPLCVGIDPHAGLLRDWGLADDPRAWSGSRMTVRRGARPARSRCSSRSRRSSSGTARAGIAVLEKAVAAAREAGALVLLDAKRGDIGSTMQGYADAYLDQSLAAGRRRDDGQPVPRLRVAAARARHRGRPRRRRVRARAHLQPRGRRRCSTRAHRRTARVAGRSSTRIAAENAGAAPMGSVGAVVGANLTDAAPRTSQSTGRCWLPGFGAQGGTVDVRPCSVGSRATSCPVRRVRCSPPARRCRRSVRPPPA